LTYWKKEKESSKAMRYDKVSIAQVNFELIKGRKEEFEETVC